MTARTAPHGFSLIELLITIVLMGMLAALAVPNWHKLFASYALNSAARQVQSELHNLKMRAVAENAGFQLSYLDNASEYSVARESQVIQTKPVARGISIIKAGAITFSPRGTAGANRVRLKDGNGICRQIVVSATGRVRHCTPASCAEACECSRDRP